MKLGGYDLVDRRSREQKVEDICRGLYPGVKDVVEKLCDIGDLELLGNGGHAFAYELQNSGDEDLDGLVFKFLNDCYQETVPRISEEYRVLTLLRRKAGVPVAYQEFDGGFVMEKLEGTPLKRLVDLGSLNFGMKIDVLVQLADILSEVHEVGVVHRDLKPDNILVSSSNKVSVLDFGIGMRLGNDRYTPKGRMVGFPTFMAPEMVAIGGASSDFDCRSDIYQIGMIGWTMFVGEMPMLNKSIYNVFSTITRGQVLSVLEKDLSYASENHVVLPFNLRDVFKKAMAFNAEDRYQSMAEFKDTLLGLGYFRPERGEREIGEAFDWEKFSRVRDKLRQIIN